MPPLHFANKSRITSLSSVSSGRTVGFEYEIRANLMLFNTVLSMKTHKTQRKSDDKWKIHWKKNSPQTLLYFKSHVINLYVYSKKDQRITKLITMNSVVYGGWLIYIPNQQKRAIITLAWREVEWGGVEWYKVGMYVT